MNQKGNKIMNKEIILASGSKNRRALLESVGLQFKVVPSDFDEDSIQHEDPVVKVEELARSKARVVAAQNKGFIISGDTFTVIEGREYQKPLDLDDARTMLKSIAGKSGYSVTGICIIDTERGIEVTTHRKIPIECRQLTDDEIEAYVNQKPVTQWAAAYNPLDELSSSIFRAIDGYSYGLQYGLPVDIIADELAKIGVKVDLSPFENV